MKQFKPMLAETVDFDLANPTTSLAAVRFPVLASPKLDGVRAIVRSGVVVSRKLLPIPNAHVQALFGRAEFEGLDGELIVGDSFDPECYNRTVSGVMSRDGEPDVWFHVFDDLSAAPGAFEARSHQVMARTLNAAGARVFHVEHCLIHYPAVLSAYESAIVDMGFEGIMLRSVDGPYKFGRSTLREGYLLKVKRFRDDDAEIIGVEELMHNDNAATVDELGHTKRSSHKANQRGAGTLGALIARDLESGIEFKVGTGFDAATRAELWLMHEIGVLAGKVFKYRHQPAGRVEKPRFPSWIGFRHAADTGAPQ